jgi:hypothetical protein
MIAGLETNSHRKALPITLRQAGWSQNSGCQYPTYLAGSTHSIGPQRHRPACDSAAGLR